jgi:IclR family acetate operon transcriptional repressor
MLARPSQTGGRVLRVLEAIAHHQPVGTRLLARILGQDKSAIQRALTTLADEGWIHRDRDHAGRWRMAPRILAIADQAFGGYDLRHRARPLIERLRDDCGETVSLIALEENRLMIADVVESRAVLRVVPPLSVAVIADRSAAGRAILAHVPPMDRAGLLGREPDAALLRTYAETVRRGYAVSTGETDPAATAVGAVIIAFDGHPAGAVSIIGPSERIDRDRVETLGRLAAETARALSWGATGYRPVGAPDPTNDEHEPDRERG